MSKPPIVDTPENWDAASKGYAKKVAPVMMASYVEEFVDRLDVSKDHMAIEVAAGSGALTLELAPRVSSLLSTDFSPQMLELLQQNVNAAGISNVTTQIMDGQALTVGDNSFDRAACCFGLMLFPDRAKGFSELYRVLKPGGRAMVSGWGGPDIFEGFKLFFGAINQVFPDMPPPPEPPPVFSLSDLGKFKSEMENAGFRNVETGHVERKLVLDSFDTLWSMFTVGAPPVEFLFSKIGPEGEVKVKEALKGIVSEKFGDGPVTLSNTATVAYGEK